jgi:hypothetical protein
LPLEELIVYVIVILGAIIACSLVIYAMKKHGKEKKEAAPKEKLETEWTQMPFKIVKSVSPDEATRAKEELRILELEREILSDAIRRLYEAHAEGKISEEERERLAQTYKTRMMSVKEAIAKDESLVALHELEAMQEDLIKLFSERFDELSSKIEELRSKVEAKPIKEIAIPTTKAPQKTAIEEKPAAEEKEKRKKKPAPTKTSPRTEAEKRIEEIRAEVEKVLERLGQMEIET